MIAAEGPREPDDAHAQRRFNTGFVVLLEYGHRPTPDVLRRVEGIRRQWLTFWDTATGHRASMTSTPLANAP